MTRCLKPERFSKIKRTQLHHFADASQIAYSAVSYARMVNANNDVHCAFLIGKSRLAPLKTMTIPRLELSAAVLAVNLDRMLQRELDITIHDSIFWTDSMTVLQYIENETRRFHTFVANRLAIIHDGSEPSQWRYVDTDLNPADDATRGLTVAEIMENNRWLRGPEFLWKEEDNWPLRPYSSSSTLVDPEIKREVQVKVVTNQPQEPALSLMIKKYSSYYAPKKPVAWLTRFKKYIVQRYKEHTRCNYREGDKGYQVPSGDLTLKEVQAAERDIVGFVQRESFRDYGAASNAFRPSKEASKMVFEEIWFIWFYLQAQSCTG